MRPDPDYAPHHRSTLSQGAAAADPEPIRFTYPESWAVSLDGGWQQAFFLAEGRCEGSVTGRFRPGRTRPGRRCRRADLGTHRRIT